MNKYSCSICKELLSKYKKNRKRYTYTPKDLLSWMIDWDTEEEVIEHIKKKHKKIYSQIMKGKNHTQQDNSSLHCKDTC